MLFGEFIEALLTLSQLPDTERLLPLSALLRQLEPSDVSIAIHMLQGRFEQGYRRRQNPDGKFLEVLKSDIDKFFLLKSRDTSIEEQTLAKVYELIHAAWPDVRSWLIRERRVPYAIAKLAGTLRMPQFPILAHMLAGPLFEDETLFKVILLFDPRSTPDMLKTLRDTYNHTLPDLGFIACQICEKGIAALIDMPPICGIPLPLEKLNLWLSLEAAWDKTGPCLVQLKYDGIYVQIHKFGDQIRLFGRPARYGAEWSFQRDWLELNERVPELVAACQKEIPADSAIIEGELVGYWEDQQKIAPGKQILRAPIHKIYLYELLYLNDMDLRMHRYYSRHKQLEDLLSENKGGDLHMASEEYIESFRGLESVYNKAISDPVFEGIITKKRFDTYRSGRQSTGKGKVKRYISIDAVILGYWQKDAQATSILVGIWNGDPSTSGVKLVPISNVEKVKAETDVWPEIVGLLEKFAEEKKPVEILSNMKPYRWVKPYIVVEVGCDGQRVRDPRFRNVGYTFRDKTFLRLRPDKSLWEADNVDTFMGLRLAPGEH